MKRFLTAIACLLLTGAYAQDPTAYTMRPLEDALALNEEIKRVTGVELLPSDTEADYSSKIYKYKATVDGKTFGIGYIDKEVDGERLITNIIIRGDFEDMAKLYRKWFDSTVNVAMLNDKGRVFLDDIGMRFYRVGRNDWTMHFDK